MTKFVSATLATLYWPVVGVFGLAIVVYLISFFTTIERSATGSYYDTGSLKSIAVVILILVSSVVMKQRGNTQLAHIILYVPFGLVVASVLIFFAIAMLPGKGS